LIDSHEQPKVLTVAPSPEKLPNLSRHAFGVDDVAEVLPVPKPALRAAHSYQAHLVHLCWAPKAREVDDILGQILTGLTSVVARSSGDTKQNERRSRKNI